MRHKHADLIHAWAEGAEIEIFFCEQWCELRHPGWYDYKEYRIKPKEHEWHDNIPKQGVLCWVSDYPEHDPTIDIIISVCNERYESATDKWNIATPLTDDETLRFLRGE